jgi:hypothetical protein
MKVDTNYNWEYIVTEPLMLQYKHEGLCKMIMGCWFFFPLFAFPINPCMSLNKKVQNSISCIENSIPICQGNPSTRENHASVTAWILILEKKFPIPEFLFPVYLTFVSL